MPEHAFDDGARLWARRDWDRAAQRSRREAPELPCMAIAGIANAGIVLLGLTIGVGRFGGRLRHHGEQRQRAP